MYKLTRFLAEWLFERELDEDYVMGTRYGAEMNRKATLMQLQLLHDQANKGHKAGIAKAIENLGGKVRESAE
jgi:hypothetical protein